MSQNEVPTGYRTLNEAEIAEAKRLDAICRGRREEEERQREARRMDAMLDSITEKLIHGGRC